MRKRRILASIMVLGAIIFLPYWIYLPLLLTAMALLPFYWEAIIFGFLIDVLYGPDMHRLFSPAALSALVILVLLLPLRERLRLEY